MYPEFLVIYIGLGVVNVLLAAVLVLLIKLLRSGSAVPRQVTYQPPAASTVPARPAAAPAAAAEAAAGERVAFCKVCAAELSPTQRFCPKCGTRR